MRRLGAALLAVLLGAAVVGGLARVRVDTGVESFLPSGDPSLAAVQRKASEFGGDPVIVLLRYPQPHQFVTDPAQALALLRTERRLADLPDAVAVYGPATVLTQLVGTVKNMLAQVAGQRDVRRMQAEQAATAEGKPPEQVKQAGSAAVTELDLRYVWLLLQGLPMGLPSLENPRFTEALMFEADGQPKPRWRFIVPDVDTVAILVRPRQDLDQAGTRALVDGIRATVAAGGLATSSVTISGVPTVTAELAGEVAHEGPLIGALVALAVLLRYLLVPAPGSHSARREHSATRTGRKATNSGALFQPRRRVRREHWQRLRPLAASLVGSAATLAGFGWLGYPLSLGTVVLLPLLLGVGSSFPLYLATLADRRRVVVMSAASAAAFLALALSPLPFVRDLGFALAAGIALTVAAALALNRWWPAPAVEPPAAEEPAVEPADTGTALVTAPDRREGARRVWWRWAVGGLVAVAVLGWSVLPWISVSSNPVELARGLPALADARTVESTLGASGEISVQLTGKDTLSPEALAWSRAAHEELTRRYADRLRPVVGVTSLFGFLGEHPTPHQIDAAMNLMPPYLSSSIVHPDRHAALLVYGVKLQDLGEQRRMLADARAALPPPPPGYAVDIVGLPVAAVRGYELLLGERYLSNLAGIAAAALVLAFGLGRADAARAAGAALLATGWGLAAIWVFGMSLSPLTVGLGSLVSVTGCEFAVLLGWAHRRGRPWLRRSVGYACLTSVLGYLALVGSRLELVREFGLVLGVAVVLSYLAAKLVVRLGPPRAGAAGSTRPGAAVEVNA
ncbi:hypothetical protein [Pseudonocardia acaciae]|uniref:hypothetical protein n=1 Tax=Pseudonocardia acaciae TaxID=551276 RepID=UPI00048C5607|nr:hypothetical protein [Pseudonocardia acaciae]